MASIRTFKLPHYEAYPVQVALFKHVKNSAFLRSQLLEANPDFDYAFLDAEMILSPSHLLTASFLSLHAILTSRHKTHTPHSELVFRLSPTNNIGESYKKFGLSDSTTDLIAVKLPLKAAPATGQEGDGAGWMLDECVTNESVSKHLGEVVEGSSVRVGEKGVELGGTCDVEKVKKMYKIGGGDVGKKAKKDAVVNGDPLSDDERRQMESVIIGTMALKGA